MRVKKLTIPCESNQAAQKLQAEYEYIGVATRREGRFLVVKTTTL